MAVLKPYKGDYYLWKFIPSLAASIIFTILFLAVSILHFWRMYTHRSWFCVWFAIGCLCEVIGYTTRVAAYNDTSSLTLYVLQISFPVIAPAFFAASIYMTLGRIIRCVKGEHLSLIRVSRLTKTFVIGDFLSLSIQGSASNLTTNEKPNIAKIGEDLVIAGLFIQLALLAFFFVVGAVFQKRLRGWPTTQSCTTDVPWRETLYMIYSVSALIFFRSIFRVVEYIQGHDGYSLTHEWTLYVFDAVPMFLVAMAFWWWYPGYIQPAIESVDNVQLDNRRHKSGGS